MEKVFLLKNLTCANCSAKIEERIRQMDQIQSANYTLATQQLRVTTDVEDDNRLIHDFQEICDAIEEGVNVEKYERLARGQEGEDGDEEVGLIDRVALFLGIIGIFYEIAIQFVPALQLPKLSEAIIFIIMYLLIAFPILRSAVRNIGKGEIFDENFLMAIATIGALIIGEYPEAVGVMVFYRIGELFEERATKRSRSEIMGAVDMRPQEVRLVTDDGIQVLAPEFIHVGDIIEVRPGDSIPLDGTIVEGETRINTAPVTGEPVPVVAKVGTELLSGCINESGRITMRVDKVLSESMVSKILDAVENAAASKPKIDRFITRFARVYTPIVVSLAILVAIIPSLFTGDWSKWCYTALTFLVISCPCALVLSVPLAFFSGIGNASKKGILLKGGLVIEALSKIKAVALDKTGTITTGVFAVQSLEPVDGVSKESLLGLAASVEVASNHPIAMSIVAEAVTMSLLLKEATQVQEIAGQGLLGMVDGHQVLVGNRRLLENHSVSNVSSVIVDFGTEVLVAYDGQYMGHLLISDAIRPDSVAAIACIKNKGITTLMLTGDSQASANYVANQTAVDEVKAHLLPQDKLSSVQSFRKLYGPTMFVGDGINDAPVLAGADVGGAMGSGADAAIEAADVVFMNSSLSSIAHVLDLSVATVRVAWQNVFFAIFVKVLVMVMGLFGYANMWWAVFADTGVAMLCILNSIRILYRKG